jgi:hypothetical protein
VLNLANAIIVWMFYPETGGQPLEAIDALFIHDDNLRRESTLGLPDPDLDADPKGVLGRLQWSIVRKADRQVKAYKRRGRRRISETTISEDATQGERQRKAHNDHQEVITK